jgi:DtxR family Mn-dependent transcriptional regulator
MNPERIEEYLETILYLSKRENGPVKNKDIAEELKISPASVSEMVQALTEQGYLSHMPYHGVELTERGLSIGEKARRKHYIIEKFLMDILKLDHGIAHNEACGLELHMSDLVVESMCTFMGSNCSNCTPLDDEHCCIVKEKYFPLSELNEGDQGTVVMMSLPRSSKERLISLGLTAGEGVEVKRKQKQGSTSIISRGVEIALGNEIARKIFVRRGKISKRWPRGDRYQS